MSNRLNVQNGGFTLIELLVVVSIIALLVGLLMPALASARGAGQSVKCGSNARQLVMANAAYAMDHTDFYALGAENLYTTNLKRWHGTRSSSGAQYDPTKGPLSPYFQSHGSKVCPTFVSKSNTGGYENGSGGYGYNTTYIGARADLFPAFDGGAYGRSARMDDLGSPSETIMFSDAAGLSFPDGNIVEESVIYTPLLISNAGLSWQNQSSMHFRHLGGSAQVAMADGHARSEVIDYSFNPYSSLTAHQQTFFGWYGPQNNDLFDVQ